MSSLGSEQKRPPLVLSAIDYVSREQSVLLQQACVDARVEQVSWQKRTGHAFGRGWPSLLVAGLPSGVRRVPDELASLLNQDFPHVPLLLLCQEPLARPTMTSHAGRVVLLGAPLSASLIASRIRMLTDLSSGLRARYWVGGSRCGATAPEPLIHERQDSGLTAILPLSSEPPEAGLAQRLSTVLREAEGELRSSEARRLLGLRHAAVHLDPSADSWLVYAPLAEHALSLCSAQRLPRVYGLAEAGGTPCIRHTRAAGGDLLLMSTAPAAPLIGRAHGALSDGAPGFFGSLDGPQFDDLRPFSSILVELL